MAINKERIHWIDVAKGLLILLLLVHHFGSATRNSIIPNGDFGFVSVWQFVYTAFFMQAFLFMSGFCSNFTAPTETFVKKILKQLVVPFCFFELITCVYWSSQDNFSIKAVFDYWIKAEGTHYWFLNALILSKVYIYLFLKYCKNEYNLVISSLLLLIVAVVLNDSDIGSNFFRFRQSLGSIFFVALGFFAKSRQKIMDKFLPVGGAFYLVSLFVLVVVFRMLPPVFTAIMAVNVKSLPLFLVTSIGGIMAFTFICKKIKVSKILEYWGRNSLVVYGIHFIPLQFLIINLYGFLLPDSLLMRLLYVLIVYCFEIIICSLLIELFNRIPLKWVVGKY